MSGMGSLVIGSQANNMTDKYEPTEEEIQAQIEAEGQAQAEAIDKERGQAEWEEHQQAQDEYEAGGEPGPDY